MPPEVGITLADVVALTVDLGDALRAAGAAGAASVLDEAVAEPLADTAARLLVLRSALVRTRAEWSQLDDESLAERGRVIVAKAKRLAIDEE